MENNICKGCKYFDGRWCGSQKRINYLLENEERILGQGCMFKNSRERLIDRIKRRLRL